MKNQRDTIRKIVSQLNNEEADGGFWLPNIQRPFVWSEEQMERLFDSIMRQYPISTLLVWKSTSRIRRRKFIDNWKEGTKLTNFYVPENAKTKKLVLDGQQRLQSLFIGLRGSYDGRELFFHVLSGDLVAPEDIRYQFKFLDSKSASWPWVRFKDIVFSGATPSKLAQELAKKAPAPLAEAARDRLLENLERARIEFSQDENIAYQELDSIDDPDAYKEEDVVEIFIRANSGGTKLGKSDLLFSLLSSTWDEADQAMEDLLEEINKGEYAFDRDFVLKTSLTLLGKGARYEVKKFREGKTREEIIAKWDEISESIQEVRDFVYGKTFIKCDHALPSYLSLIPLIYFRYTQPQKWPQAKDLSTYLIRSLLCGAFSGTPDNLIDKCTTHIDLLESFDVVDIFEVMRSDGRNLELNADTILGHSYGDRGIHLLFNLWYRDFNYVPAYVGGLPQVDHIFPQSALKKLKSVNPETGRKSLQMYPIAVRNQLANCMLLSAEENGAGGKSDTLPAEWFKKKVDEFGAEYLDRHLIPNDPSLWELQNFEKFIEKRKELILTKFNFMLRPSSTRTT